MIKRNVYSWTKAIGRLYYIKDVGTLEQEKMDMTKLLKFEKITGENLKKGGRKYSIFVTKTA